VSLARTSSFAIVVLAIACLASMCAGDDSYPADLSKWIETEPPGADSDRWFAANHSEREWIVFWRDSRPAVRIPKEEDADWKKLPFAIKVRWTQAEGLIVASVKLQTEKRSRRDRANVYAAKVADGWIVGLNAGEFGASLWWFAPDGKKWYQISDDQVRGFVQTEQGLLALEGLAHMGIDRGHIIAVNRGANGQWQSDPFVDLGSAPDAATHAKDGSLIVVTTTRLFRVRLDKQVDILLDRAFWGGLYPNSVIVDGAGTVFIGMRHGVAKVTRAGRKPTVRWLLPNQAAVDARPRF
jgi:hypothetical protein